MAVLEIKSLEMSYKTQEGNVRAIDRASLRVEKGDIVGIVGESGCGKTSLGLSILGLLPSNATIHGGQILFKDQDLLSLSEKDMRKIRWNNISMIFQAAMNALDPVYRVGDQLIEALLEHQNLTKKQASDKMEAMFQLVGLDPARARNYPHEYSGGMKQRAIIAMSLICDPDIIIADEATTALDVLVQDRILSAIKKIQKELTMTMLYISHDIAVVSEVCNKIGVMYAGNIVELGDTMSLFKTPLHPYTQGLMRSFPKIQGSRERLEGIPGEPPRLTDSSVGCRFFPRCQQSLKECNSIRPEFTKIEGNHWVACHAARRSL